MSKLIVFNLKMNAFVPANWSGVKKSKSELVVCPAFTDLRELKKLKTKTLKRIKIGAQNCFWEDSSAYTGEVSPKMLKNLGVEYVIIGHSERRKNLNETDEMINKKVSAALKAGLKVVLCIGEPSGKSQGANRKAQISQAKKHVKNQLVKDLKTISDSRLALSSLIVAYEPVWSISTTKNAKVCPPEYALEMAKFIKQILNTKYKIPNIKVLYGGSVNGKNVGDFIQYKEIDGVLVGGASLDKKQIKEIINKTNN